MFPPFDEESAFEKCIEIADKFGRGIYMIVPLGKESEERRNSPVMLGVLLCTDGAGAEKILFTVSGISRAVSKPDDENFFVEPVVPPEKISGALSGNDAEIHSLTERINSAAKNDSEASVLKARRKSLTDESFRKVFALYSFHCADGKARSLNSICGKKIPPTGTGECCAPKLLHFCFRNGWTPMSLCEIPYSPLEKKAGGKIPPCDDRCSLILPSILGIEILYRDAHIVVVNKQSGILSVPGRGEDKQDCIASRVRRLFPACIAQPAVHRLDMETSGLMVLALTNDARRNLGAQFERGEVRKEYVALVDGVLPRAGIAQSGSMELYFRLDVENRPRQIWDAEFGKRALTEWNVLGVEKYAAPDGSRRDVTRVEFFPRTGRTHQLRLACSDPHGFGLPIIGDTLYGKRADGERLMLHARRLEFTHPQSGERVSFFCPPEF